MTPERWQKVSELVEGPTLADRVAAGPTPVKEALTIARQIAEAVEAAHEKGIIHRDLKPANIKVTRDGHVKVLDFGLAKAIAGDGLDPDPSHLPTVTAAGTREGVILGTAAYMGPEQARGQAIDKRTDIWAFGCVLYEMLTGRAAFGRGTIADTIAEIVEREPDWALLPSSLSPRVQELLRLCLEKDVKKRYRDSGDIRIHIEHALTEMQTSRTVGASQPPRIRRPAGIGAAAALAAAAAVVVIFGTSSCAGRARNARADQHSRYRIANALCAVTRRPPPRVCGGRG